MEEKMFKHMYLLLFRQITEAIQALGCGDPAQARTILIRAQQDAEALYIEGTEEWSSRA